MAESSNHPICSIIVPAHNEAAVIERFLSSLLRGLDLKKCEVIVVANGCTDNTAANARSIAGVNVVELQEASKVAALNAGDEAARGEFRAYVDADVLIEGTAVHQVIDYLVENPSVHAAAPQVQFDLSGASFAVKAFYRVWQSLPYLRDQGLIGSGVYVLSPAGRSRFSAFPNLIADDGYVRSLFSQDERRVVTSCSFTVFAPKRLKSLIKIKTRVRLGNMELAQKMPHLALGTENSPSSLFRVVLKQPRLVAAAIIYVYTQLVTKRRARARFESAQFSVWDRDETSRH